MQRSEYSSRWGISQSMIKKWRFISPLQWKKLYIDLQKDEDNDKNSFTLGSLVDTLCFTPDELEKRFVVAKAAQLPSDAIVLIMKNYYDAILKLNKEIEEVNKSVPMIAQQEILPFNLEARDLLISCANNVVLKDKDGNEKIGWNTNWKEETRIKNLVEKGSEYFNALVEAAGRKVISYSLNMEAIEMRDILHTDETVKDYFIENENNTLLFQLEIFVDHISEEFGNKIPLKGALDIVRFDHKNQTVQIIDFKTSRSAFEFIQSIKQYGYCDQLSYYCYLLKLWLNQYCEGKYCHYTIINPINIVIDSKDKIPYIYEYNDTDLLMAKKGNAYMLNYIFDHKQHPFREKSGWMQLLDEICWHYFTGNWQKPKELYLNGKIQVNLLNS